MNWRLFFGVLLLTSWIPVVCGITAARWFRQQEAPGAGYESTAMLTSEDWKKYREDPPFLEPVDSNPILATSYLLTSPSLEQTVRESMGLEEVRKRTTEVQVETTEFSSGSIGVRVVGQEPALVQAYLTELLTQYSLWSKKMVDASHGHVVAPIIEGILELREEMGQFDQKLRTWEGGLGQGASNTEIQRLKQEREAALRKHAELEARLQMEDSKMEKSKEPFTILEGPTAPSRVRITMGEAALWGELVGVGVGAVLIVLIALMTRRMRSAKVGIP